MIHDRWTITEAVIEVNTLWNLSKLHSSEGCSKEARKTTDEDGQHSDESSQPDSHSQIANAVCSFTPPVIAHLVPSTPTITSFNVV